MDENISKKRKKNKKTEDVKEKISKPEAKSPVIKDDDKPVRTGISVYYLIVICLMGLPIWYQTTSPARHSLPDISSLLVSYQMSVHKVTVTVVSMSQPDPELKQHLMDNWPRRPNFDGAITFEFEWRVRRLMEDESSIFASSKSLKEVDEALYGLESRHANGRLYVYLTDKLNDGYSLGSYRAIYLAAKMAQDVSSLAETIYNLVDLSLNPRSTAIDFHDITSTSTDPIKFLLRSEMDLTINFVAQSMSDALKFRRSKKIADVHKLTDDALLAESGIKELIDLRIATQMVYNSFDSDFLSNQLVNDSKNLYYSSHNIPELFRAVESRVVAHNAKEMANLIVILPSESFHFSDTASSSVSNSIMTMHKDGVLIWNEDKDFRVGFKRYIRSLLGLNGDQNSNVVTRNVFFSLWELDSLKRRLVALRLAKTLSSMESIQKLLHKVRNIVILEEIAARMHSAVDDSHRAIRLIADGDLDAAYRLSGKAYLASETAFFDPSLLALLYFPDDQKYAVYFPLFLPISLPLVTSLWLLMGTASRRMRSKAKSD